MPSRQKGGKTAGSGPNTDLYAELEVDRNCSQEELRKQYKRLAMRYHPDKNEDNREAAEQKFQRLAYAFEILSDPAKRKAYDQGGADAVRAMESSATGGLFDPFSFFGGSDPFDLFARFFGQKRGRGFGLYDQQVAPPLESPGAGRPLSLGDDGFFSNAFSDDSFSNLPSEGCTSRSVTERTVVRDGRQVTKRVTKTQEPDGTRQTLEEEWVNGEKTSTKTIGGSAAPAIEGPEAKRPREGSAKGTPAAKTAKKRSK